MSTANEQANDGGQGIKPPVGLVKPAPPPAPPPVFRRDSEFGERWALSDYEQGVAAGLQKASRGNGELMERLVKLESRVAGLERLSGIHKP